MWPGAWWLAAICIAVAVNALYSEYSNAKMPDYDAKDAGDYDSSRDYYLEQAPDPPHPQKAPSDYKYEEETGNSKNRNDLADAETWQNPTKNSKFANRNKLDTFDFNSDEIDLKLSSRLQKYRPRNKIKFSQDDEGYRLPARDGPYDKKQASDINAENNFRDGKIDLRDENNDYNDNLNLRAMDARVIRRKPRDRYVKPPTKDEDVARTFESDFLLDADTNLKPRTTVRNIIKPIRSNLEKSKPKAEYDSNYFDMERIFRTKQKYDRDSNSNNDVPDRARVTSADWWTKRYVGEDAGRMKAEVAVSHTKQVEDITSMEDSDMIFPDLYPKKILEKKLEEQDFKLPYTQPFLTKQKDPEKEHSIVFYPDWGSSKQDNSGVKEDFQPLNNREEMENIGKKDRKLPYPRPSQRDPILDSLKKVFEPPYSRPNDREQIEDSTKKKFELPYPRPSHGKKIEESIKKESELPYPRPNPRPSHRDPILDSLKKVFRPNHKEEMENIRKEDFELPYPRPNINNPINEQTIGSINGEEDVDSKKSTVSDDNYYDDSISFVKSKNAEQSKKPNFSAHPTEKFSIDGRIFADESEYSANVNNIVDYGPIITKPTILTGIIKNKNTTTVAPHDFIEHNKPKQNFIINQIDLTHTKKVQLLTSRKPKKIMLNDLMTTESMQETGELLTEPIDDSSPSLKPWRQIHFLKPGRPPSPSRSDAPDIVMKVKRLMRAKLIASAQKESDLSENLDDLICDDIDMSSFDTDKSVKTTGLPNVCLILSIIILIL